MLYQTDQAQRLLRLARWLIAQADKRGMTHGEKHHWLFVAAQINEEVLNMINRGEVSFQTMDPDLKESDIPF